LTFIVATRLGDLGVANVSVAQYPYDMKLFLGFIGWCVLFVLCWPLAILALIVFPLVWLVSIPFRLAAYVIGAMLALVQAILFLPARLLGARPRG
jgi:hypothetical protein